MPIECDEKGKLMPDREELARLVRVSPRSIRDWERMGVSPIRPQRYDGHLVKRAIYTEEDIETLRVWIKERRKQARKKAAATASAAR
jgi:DNA-binding transcriptional MerR regulator